MYNFLDLIFFSKNPFKFGVSEADEVPDYSLVTYAHYYKDENRLKLHTNDKRIYDIRIDGGNDVSKKLLSPNIVSVIRDGDKGSEISNIFLLIFSMYIFIHLFYRIKNAHWRFATSQVQLPLSGYCRITWQSYCISSTLQ